MPRIPVNMPKMSMTMEYGTLVEWSVAVGDEVKDGDVLCVVTTDKVDMDVEAVANGTVAELVAEPGQAMRVGLPMAYLESASEDLLGDLFDGSDDSSAADDGASQPNPSQPNPSQPNPSQDNAADTEAIESGAHEVDSGDEPSLGGDPLNPGGPDSSEPSSVGTAPVGEAATAGMAEGAPERVRAVPLARTLAKEFGIDLRQVAASHPGQVVRARDVREAVESVKARSEQLAPTQAPAPTQEPTPTQEPVPAGVKAAPTPAATPATSGRGQIDRRSRVRQATARVMTASAGIPQFTAYRTLDLTELSRARKAGLKGVSWTTLMVRAYALVLEQFPNLNGSWTASGVRSNNDIVVSLAVDTPDGLLAPAVHNPHRTSVKALDAQIRDMAARLKDGDQSPDLFVQGTGTVSNLGGMGVEMFNALLTPPQATALSLGSVSHKVGSQDGEPRVFMGCTVGLTLDHRAADGADAARALDALQQFLADPVGLLA